MKKVNNILLVYVMLVFYSCFSVPEIHYTESMDNNEKAIRKDRLMIQLYNDDIYNEKISIKTDDNILIFQGSKVNKGITTRTSGNSKVLEFTLNKNIKDIEIKYSGKRYKLNINEKYSILFLELREGIIDALYTNREPIYTD
ncbi:hypothetical protein LF887_10755 [Chryseobacterium sp. MEBOG06]|uniref:hypothetical protein n=1 Tax=unclassified Chryseobacterium TaxID=2593645 RepID=UPI001F20EFAE|nr:MULTISPECIES: hypothetical protein [unclassified Chryseobacterium]UKB86077.1 hypothetical protein LF887_10755 [Chryseobacterium sp. MEBOG06]